MKDIVFTYEEFKEELKEDPRIGEEYLEQVELPQAFASGNRFLKKYILKKSGYYSQFQLSTEWFKFSQLIEEIEINKERIKIRFDEEAESNPPLMSRKYGI